MTIRAIRSLNQCHVVAISQAVTTLSAKWSIDQHDDYKGYLSVVISRQNQDGIDLTYLISGSLDQIELAKLHADELTALGCFFTIDDLTAELAKTLASALPHECRR